MPRRDAYYDAVRQALVKDGWTITHDPLMIRYKGLRVFIDLAAEKIVAGDEGRIAVEIKVFGGRSAVDDFEKAIGQYSLYRSLLTRIRSERELFLAVAQHTYDSFFQVPAIQEYLSEHQIQVLIFDDKRAEVVKWIRWKS